MPHVVPALLPLLALTWLISSGCANGENGGEKTTEVMQARTPAAVGHPAIRKAIVQAMLARDDLRRQMEDEFARQLQAHGVATVPSYTLSTSRAGPLSREELKQNAERLGADAVLIAGLVRVDRETMTEPGRATGARGEFRPGYAPLSYESYAQPPTTREQRTAILETKLFDARTTDLLLAANSHTVIMTDPAAEIPGFVRAIIDNIGKAQLLPSSSSPSSSSSSSY